MPRPPRPCLICGTLTNASRCPQHTQTGRAPKHPNRQRPGHRTQHDRARKQWEPFIKSGTWPCTRCGQPILQDQQWDIDQRPWGMEPAHSRCNRQAGGRHEP